MSNDYNDVLPTDSLDEEVEKPLTFPEVSISEEEKYTPAQKIHQQVEKPRRLSMAEIRWDNIPAVLNAMRQLDPALNNFMVTDDTEDILCIGKVNREDLSEEDIQRLLGIAKLLGIYGEAVIYPDETTVITLWRTDTKSGPLEDSPEDFGVRFMTLWRILLPMGTDLGQCECNLFAGGKAVMLSCSIPMEEWTLIQAKIVSRQVELFGVRAEIVTTTGYGYWIRVMERPIE